MMRQFLEKVESAESGGDDNTVVVILSEKAARELFAALGTSLGV